MQVITINSNHVIIPGHAPMRCVLGAGGICEAGDKREGDGATPRGVYYFRRVLYRADRIALPQTALPLRAIAKDDGWCDAPGDRAYNRPVALPYPASAEQLWRDDHVYDLLAIISHNDDPPIPGLGSAIFVHLAREDYSPTRGCVALAEADLRTLLGQAGPQTRICIDTNAGD